MSVGYIQPNSTIVLLSAVPLDPSYEHSLYFTDGTAQYNYFYSNRILNGVFSEQSYQRKGRNKLRIEIQPELIYNANYLMFQNTPFGNKWFYAFITDIEYVNNNVAEVTYELDVLQSWYFSGYGAGKGYELRECFIERQHTESDKLWEHLVPENLPLGDSYVTNNSRDGILFDDWSAVVLASVDYTEGQTATPAGANYGLYNPLLIACCANYYLNGQVNYPELDRLKKVIDDYVSTGHEDAIVAVLIVPGLFGYNFGSVKFSESFTVHPNLTTIDGYTPLNYKVFNYPYNYMYLTTCSGNSATYKFEDWLADYRRTPDFDVTGTAVPIPQIMCEPSTLHFNNGGLAANDFGIMLGDLPIAPWVGDVWAAYWAQSKGSYQSAQVVTALSTLYQVGHGGATAAYGLATGDLQTVVEGGGRMANAGFKGVSEVIARNIMLEGTSRDLKNTPPTVHGLTQSGAYAITEGKLGFNVYQKTIRAETAKIIDRFFTRYGYAINKIGVPNIKARPKWTYVKTVGCLAVGMCPAADIAKICAIFDNGITWWQNAEDVGRFTQLEGQNVANERG